MASGSTTRRSLPYPLETDSPDVAADIHSLATALDAAFVSTSAGATNISTSESRTNIAYGTLTTPDQVTGIVLPANGLIQIRYQATWQESVSGAARAAIFIGANQLESTASSATDTAAQSAATNNDTAATNNSLASCPIGLASGKAQFHSGDVTTGQTVGVHGGNAFIGGALQTGVPSGACEIFATAGTYTISVQFKASSGSVTASNRKLWVRAIPYA